MSSSSWDTLSSNLAVLLLMSLIAVHLSHRLKLYRKKRLSLVLFCLGVLLYVFYLKGVFSILWKIQEILSHSETTLRSPSGIARFCQELKKVAETQYTETLALLTLLYLTLQTFCVPGTVALNAAIGAISGTLVGVPFCTLLGTCGASCCYLMSAMVGTNLVVAVDRKLMRGEGLPQLQERVQTYRDDLLVYLLFLRLTPILPNWLVNLASPVVGVPLRTFMVATFFGILPQTYISVRFGSLAHQSSEDGEQKNLVTVWDTLLLALLGCTVVVVYRLRKRFDKKK